MLELLVSLQLDLNEIFSASMILFAVIDIIGVLPVLLDIENKTGYIDPTRATLVSALIMIVFLFVGEKLLNIIGIDLYSFAAAGSFVLFLIALEMILDVRLFHGEPTQSSAVTVVPVAFPLIAGTGTLTTILTIRSTYHFENVMLAILINALIIYVVLRLKSVIKRFLGETGLVIVRRVFGIILLAAAIKIFKTYGLNLNA